MGRLFVAVSFLALVGCRDDATAPAESDTDSGTTTMSSTSSSTTATDATGSTGVEERTVEILIDDRGIAHVFGQTDEDAMYGAGYMVARDRLFQLEMFRRLLLGRQAEVLGSAAQITDQQLRIFDVPRWGRADAEVMREQEPEIAAMISAWAEGINAYIAEIQAGDAPLPFGFRQGDYDFQPEPFSEDDPYIMLKGAELGLGRTLEFEIALTILTALFPEPVTAVQPFRPAHPVFGLPPEDRPGAIQEDPKTAPAGPSMQSPYPPELVQESFDVAQRFMDNMPGFAASNNWAVAGKHTESGRPLIAGDPHLDFALMGAMYPLHINSAEAGGTLNVAGFALPGVPGISLGHTEKVAWTQTTAFGDVMDIWTVNPQGGQVRMGDDMVPVTDREEVFIVRSASGPVGEGSMATMTYQDVEGWGTIVPTELLPLPIGGPFLLNWMGYIPQTTRWPLILNQMQSLDDFDAALEIMPELNQSVLAADANGIAFGVALDVPLRKDVSGDRSPVHAMQGNDAGSLWTGEVIPRGMMPYSRASERGFLLTANNDPLGFTENGIIDDDPFFYGAFFAPGYRAKRIEDELLRLTDRGDVTLKDMQTLQMDVHSTMADDLLPLVTEAWAAAQTDEAFATFRDNEDVAALVGLLEAWDRNMARDSAGALAFEAFVHHAMEGVLKDDIEAGYDFAVALQTVFMMKLADNALRDVYPDTDVIVQEGRDAILLEALATTAAWIVDTFGAVDPPTYAYADRKVTNFDDAFGFGMEVLSAPTDGGEDTINVSENIVFAPGGETWESTWVAGERTVITFDENGTPQAFINHPVAPTADPKSDDNTKANADYIEGNYSKLLFERGEIEAAQRERIEIVRTVGN